MIKVYVAGSSKETPRVQKWVDRLREAGFEVVSTWITSIASAAGVSNPRDASKETRLGYANQDLLELRSADVLWFLVPAAERPTCGAWYEAGYADASDHARVIVSGDTLQSVFCARAEEYVH